MDDFLSKNKNLGYYGSLVVLVVLFILSALLMNQSKQCSNVSPDDKPMLDSSILGLYTTNLILLVALGTFLLLQRDTNSSPSTFFMYLMLGVALAVVLAQLILAAIAYSKTSKYCTQVDYLNGPLISMIVGFCLLLVPIGYGLYKTYKGSKSL